MPVGALARLGPAKPQPRQRARIVLRTQLLVLRDHSLLLGYPGIVLLTSPLGGSLLLKLIKHLLVLDETRRSSHSSVECLGLCLPSVDEHFDHGIGFLTLR